MCILLPCNRLCGPTTAPHKHIITVGTNRVLIRIRYSMFMCWELYSTKHYHTFIKLALPIPNTIILQKWLRLLTSSCNTKITTLRQRFLDIIFIIKLKLLTNEKKQYKTIWD